CVGPDDRSRAGPRVLRCGGAFRAAAGGWPVDVRSRKKLMECRQTRWTDIGVDEDRYRPQHNRYCNDNRYQNNDAAQYRHIVHQPVILTHDTAALVVDPRRGRKFQMPPVFSFSAILIAK